MLSVYRTEVNLLCGPETGSVNVCRTRSRHVKLSESRKHRLRAVSSTYVCTSGVGSNQTATLAYPTHATLESGEHLSSSTVV